MEIRVYFEDTDCGGVVYHANYLRYFERARTEYFRLRGIEFDEFYKAGILFAVARTDLTFHAPARYNDLLQIEIQITAFRNASINFYHQVRSVQSGPVLTEGNVTLVCVGGSGKAQRLPEKLLKVVRENFNPAQKL